MILRSRTAPPVRRKRKSRQKAAYAKVKKAFSGGKDVKVSKERFLSDEFWEDVTAKCLSCGACTYLCPTCYCFNITDEQADQQGRAHQELGLLHVPPLHPGDERP